MSQRESKLSRKIMKTLRLNGIFCFKVHGGPTMMAGLPDILVCMDGVFIGLETKNPEDRANVSLRQQMTHALIRKSGGYVYVVCGPVEALRRVRQAHTAELVRRAG